MKVFNASHVRVTYTDIQVSHRAQLSAVAPRQCNGATADFLGTLGGRQHVGRVARSADAHDDVAGRSEILQLLREYAVVAHIVGVRCDGGERVSEGMDAKALRAAVTG